MSAGSATSQDIGTYIIIAGLGVQLLFFGVFVAVACVFQVRFSSSQVAGTDVTASEKVPWARSSNGLLWVLYLVSGSCSSGVRLGWWSLCRDSMGI